MSNDDGDRPGKDEPDLFDTFLRITGWAYLAVGVAMVGFFLWWLRG